MTEGRALKLHPLACTAYNADFDGDQMAIHLPLSAEAQAEARVLMLCANHILAPKDGKPIIVPTQDMVLGTYYLTAVRNLDAPENHYFSSFDEAMLSYEFGALSLQQEIFVRIDDGCVEEKEDQGTHLVKTTVGRMIFNEKLPKELRQYSTVMNKKALAKLVAQCFNLFGATKTAAVIDEVKRLGYHFACIAGMTVAITDVIVPPQKPKILAETQEAVKKVEIHFMRGHVTERERYDKVVALWNNATERVADAMMANMDPFNPIYMMSDSGARGNKQQMRQLAGMRGLMADPSGKIIDLPITANFREGLSVSDYFISSHGARKGLADTALRTADSGYLTRRLVDVAQDVIVRQDDCTMRDINLQLYRAAKADDTFDALEILSDSLQGRVLATDVLNPDSTVAVAANTVLDEDSLIKVGEAGAKELTLRGLTLTDPLAPKYLGQTETIALAVGDQNTYPPLDTKVLQDETKTRLRVKIHSVRGIQVEAIGEGKGIIEPLWERIVGRTLAENVYDNDGNLIGKINDTIDEKLADAICSVRTKVQIRSVLTCRCPQGVCKKCYGTDLANHAEVEIGEAVGIIAAQSIGEPGTQLTMRTFHTGGVAGGDITQGLPRVEELFEARKPKMSAIISEIDGTVSMGQNEKNNLRLIIITPTDTQNLQPREYTIPFGQTIRVKPGQLVRAGEPLTAGAKNPHDILRICGLKETYRYLVKEVQKVYKSQGVEINDKHIEVMVRQMLHKVTGSRRPLKMPHRCCTRNFLMLGDMIWPRWEDIRLLRSWAGLRGFWGGSWLKISFTPKPAKFLFPPILSSLRRCLKTKKHSLTWFPTRCAPAI